MQVTRIQSIITPKNTGYAAAVSLGLAVTSGISKNNNFRKSHKFFAYVSAALTLLHIGLIEYYNYKFKNSHTEGAEKSKK